MRSAIALVPGFFGFDHRENRTYFADRFLAGLRSGLEARGVLGVPIVAVSTLGIASMYRRQVELLSELHALETPTKARPGLGGARTWHLVGHSTGGVDAALLLRERPLSHGANGSTYADGEWGQWHDLVTRIRSVTTIAAPHFGTAFAESALARLSGGHASFAALGQALSATLDLARRGDVGSRISFFFSGMPRVTQMPLFLAQLVLRNELATDLRPDVMSPLGHAPLRSDMQARVFSVVTVAPRPGRNHPDKLFRDIWTWTHNASVGLAPPPLPASPQLDDCALRLPSQRNMQLPPIDGGDSDGVVSTTRQVLGQPLAVVIGDHVDVLGRYRRASLVDGQVIDPGLLTSGADFGDDEFFSLIDRVAQRLADAIRDEGS